MGVISFWQEAVLRRGGELLPPFSLRRRFAQATFWAMAATLFAQGGTLIGSVVVGRLLGRTEFGQLSIIRSTLVLIGVVAGTSLGTAATKYVAEFRDTDPARAASLLRLVMRLAIATATAVMILFAAGANLVAEHALHQPSLLLPLRVGAILLLFNTVAGVQIGGLAGFENFAAIARISALDGVLNVVFPIVGAKFGGVLGCTAGLVVAAGIGLVLKHHYLRVSARHLPRPSGALPRGEASKAIWLFAVPAVVVAISVQPFDWLARVFLARQASGFAEVGSFAAAFTWSQIVLLVPNQFVGPLLPIMANVYGSADFAKLRRMLRATTALCVGLSFAVAVPMAIFSGDIMAAYGAQFRGAAPVLVLLLIAYSLGSLTIVFRAVLSAIGRMWTQVTYSLVWGTTLIAVMFFAARPTGALRLAVAYCAAYVAQVVVQTILTFRHLRAEEAARAAA